MAKNTIVLPNGFSFHLILTLGFLGFTCYSLHRLDTRLAAVEQNCQLTSPPNQVVDNEIVKPISAHSEETKKQIFKRDVSSSSICDKCKSFCFNSKGHRRNVSCFLITQHTKKIYMERANTYFPEALKKPFGTLVFSFLSQRMNKLQS